MNKTVQAAEVFGLDLFTDFEPYDVPPPVVENNPFVQAVAQNALEKKDAEKEKEAPSLETPQSLSNGQHADLPAYTNKKIEDFGEKIGGAKKDLYAAWRDSMLIIEADEAVKLPLAKAWPVPKYESMLEQGMEPWRVAACRALREIVPHKPNSSSYKLPQWSTRFIILREIATDIIEKKVDRKQFEFLMDAFRKNDAYFRKEIDHAMDSTALYTKLGHKRNLSSFYYQEFTGQSFFRIRGTEYRNCFLIYQKEGRQTYYLMAADSLKEIPKKLTDYFADLDKEEDELKAKRASMDPEKLKLDKEKRFYKAARWSSKTTYFLGRKIGSEWIELKAPFESAKDALAYRDTHMAELNEAYEKFRFIPNERMETNEPRTSSKPTERVGNVTPQQFLDAFGFRGVEFGNWVENDKRQGDLNRAYDALQDLAYVLNVSTKALSLDGKLGLRFGSNGSGGKHAAAAHYEPDLIAINLTKKNGAGSLAHEWFHAVDHYFGRKRGAFWATKDGEYMSNARDIGYLDIISKDTDPSTAYDEDSYHDHTKDPLRKDVVMGFLDVYHEIRASELPKRSQQLDRGRSKSYWSTQLEMAARSFEVYVKDRLKDCGVRNDYLANFVSEAQWKKTTSAAREAVQNSYPYPTAEELPKIRKAFDHLFEAMEQREHDGVVELYSSSNLQNLAAVKKDCLPCYDHQLSLEQKNLQAFAKEVLDIDIQYFDGPERYHGMYQAQEDRVYLNRESSRPLEWTMWHESFHAMKNCEPALYDELLRYTETAHPITQQQIDAFKKSIHGQELSNAQCKEELLANAFADCKSRKVIMDEMSTESPSLAKKIVSFMGTVSQKAKEFFHKKEDVLSAEQLHDFEKGLESIAKGIREEKKPAFMVTKAHQILTAKGEDISTYLQASNAGILLDLPVHSPYPANQTKSQEAEAGIVKKLLVSCKMKLNS